MLFEGTYLEDARRYQKLEGRMLQENLPKKFEECKMKNDESDFCLKISLNNEPVEHHVELRDPHSSKFKLSKRWSLKIFESSKLLDSNFF